VVITTGVLQVDYEIVQTLENQDKKKDGNGTENLNPKTRHEALLW
jgi:hypothetical protein